MHFIEKWSPKNKKRNFLLIHQQLRVIDGLEMGTVNKIYLEFDDVWWPQDIEGYAFLFKVRKAREWEIKIMLSMLINDDRH